MQVKKQGDNLIISLNTVNILFVFRKYPAKQEALCIRHRREPREEPPDRPDHEGPGSKQRYHRKPDADHQHHNRGRQMCGA